MTAPAQGRGRAATAEHARRHSGLPLFDRGYRPFFLGAGLFAALALPLWLAMLALGTALPSHLAGRDWHVHEMVFGYVGAVLAGFLLTAIPNWTGRLPVVGRPLALLAGLWLAGRIAMAVSAFAPVACAVIDAAFPAALALVAWREVLAGKNTRNVPVCVAVNLFAVANIAFHGAVLADLDRDVAERAALAVIGVLICLVGGRIVPSFTRNWLVKRGATALPAPFGTVDKATLAATVAAGIAWTAAPGSIATAVLAAVAAALLAWRLARWREPRSRWC
jgi:uncharacterized protein involved in response to NO